MALDIQKLRNMPPSAKLGVAFMTAGWLWLIASVYLVFDPASVGKFLISGLVVCWFLFSLKNWARILGLFCVGLAVLYCTVFGVILWPHARPLAIIAFVNVLLFGLSGYFLLLRTTADFFKSQAVVSQDNQD